LEKIWKVGVGIRVRHFASDSATLPETMREPICN